MSYTFIGSRFLLGEKLVYHYADQSEYYAGADDDGVWRARTRCGIVRHDEGDDRGLRGTYLSEVLAHRIARPCLRCYPERRTP
jgi:hypothetical protein